MSLDLCKHPLYHHHNQGTRHMLYFPKFSCNNNLRKCQAPLLEWSQKVIFSPTSADASVLGMRLNQEKWQLPQDCHQNTVLHQVLDSFSQDHSWNFGIVTELTKLWRPQSMTSLLPRRPKIVLWQWHYGHDTVQSTAPVFPGTAQAVGEVIPELPLKLTGVVFCVLTPNLIILGLTYCLENATV